jgi:hypothetical protein
MNPNPHDPIYMPEALQQNLSREVGRYQTTDSQNGHVDKVQVCSTSWLSDLRAALEKKVGHSIGTTCIGVVPTAEDGTRPSITTRSQEQTYIDLGGEVRVIRRPAISQHATSGIFRIGFNSVAILVQAQNGSGSLHWKDCSVPSIRPAGNFWSRIPCLRPTVRVSAISRCRTTAVVEMRPMTAEEC